MPHSPHEPDFDARTLAEAEVIKADPMRAVAARAAATNLAQQQADAAAQLANIAASSPTRTPIPDKVEVVLQSGDGRQLPVTFSRRR